MSMTTATATATEIATPAATTARPSWFERLPLHVHVALSCATVLGLVACGGGDVGSPTESAQTQTQTLVPSETARATTPTIDPALAQLGQRLFVDRNLSEPAGTACVACHQPARGCYRQPSSFAQGPIRSAAVGAGSNRRHSPADQRLPSGQLPRTGSQGLMS